MGQVQGTVQGPRRSNPDDDARCVLRGLRAICPPAVEREAVVSRDADGAIRVELRAYGLDPADLDALRQRWRGGDPALRAVLVRNAVRTAVLAVDDAARGLALVGCRGGGGGGGGAGALHLEERATVLAVPRAAAGPEHSPLLPAGAPRVALTA